MTGFMVRQKNHYDEMLPLAVSLDHLVLMISVTSGWTTAASLTIAATSKIGVCQRTLLMLETVRMLCRLLGGPNKRSQVTENINRCPSFRLRGAEALRLTTIIQD